MMSLPWQFEASDKQTLPGDGAAYVELSLLVPRESLKVAKRTPLTVFSIDSAAATRFDP